MPSNTPNKEAGRAEKSVKDRTKKLEARKEQAQKKSQEIIDNTVGKVFNTHLSLKTKLELLVFATFVAILIAYGVQSYRDGGFMFELVQFLGDRDRVNAWVSGMGVFAPFAFILLQITQTVISPIPGNVVGFAGGFLFGWWGIILSTIGSTVGYAIVLAFARRFGRDFVEKLVTPSVLEKFDYLSTEKGSFAFFMIFLIPALPDDVVMMIAGLTKLPIRQLLFLAAVGRFPSVVVTNQIGDSISGGDIPQLIILVTISLAVVGLCLWRKDMIMNLINRGRRDQKDKNKTTKN